MLTGGWQQFDIYMIAIYVCTILQNITKILNTIVLGKIMNLFMTF